MPGAITPKGDRRRARLLKFLKQNAPVSAMSYDLISGNIPALCRMMARAFEHDPLIEHVLPDVSSRNMRLVRLYNLYMNVFARLGTIHADRNSAGVAMWLATGHYPLTILQNARLLPRIAWTFGKSTGRALQVLDHLERLAPGGRNYMYLGLLGVEPTCQGRGIGSSLLQIGSRWCDEDGVGAYLETGNESNLAFYARYGFEVMHETDLPRGPHVWALWRRPQRQVRRED